MRHKPTHGDDFYLVIGAVKEAPLHRISAARAGALPAQPTRRILIVFEFHFSQPQLAARTSRPIEAETIDTNGNVPFPQLRGKAANCG
jgi:hypothetical protein